MLAHWHLRRYLKDPHHFTQENLSTMQMMAPHCESADMIAILLAALNTINLTLSLRKWILFKNHFLAHMTIISNELWDRNNPSPPHSHQWYHHCFIKTHSPIAEKRLCIDPRKELIRLLDRIISPYTHLSHRTINHPHHHLTSSTPLQNTLHNTLTIHDRVVTTIWVDLGTNTFYSSFDWFL